MRKINRQLWLTALKIYDRFFKENGKSISRNRLAKLLNIDEQTARNIIFAIENRDIIKSEPAHFETSNKTVELLFADLHIPYHDELAVQTMFDYVESEKINPNLIVILGDLIDFYQISKFDKDPRRKKVSQELSEAREFLTSLRNRFPDARILYLKGNHTARYEKYIFSNAREIADLVVDLLPQKLGLNELRIEYLEEPFTIGKLFHLHGHEKPSGAYNVEYVVNVMWKYIYDHFIVAHFHRTQQKIFKSASGKIYIGASIGCLCQLEMDYAKLNNWNHGFAIVRYDDNGNFRIENKQIFNGEVY